MPWRLEDPVQEFLPILAPYTLTLPTGLADLLKHHKWVGLASADMATIQHQTKLYLCKIRPLSYDHFCASKAWWCSHSCCACSPRKKLMYEEVLRRFANFPTIRFAKPVPITVLLQMALDSPDSGWMEEDGPKEDIVQVGLPSAHGLSQLRSCAGCWPPSIRSLSTLWPSS